MNSEISVVKDRDFQFQRKNERIQMNVRFCDYIGDDPVELLYCEVCCNFRL